MKEARFSSIQPIDRTLFRCYHSEPEWTWEQWQWRGTPHSPKLQHCWNLTIRLFSVISRTLVGGGSYPSAEKQSVYSTAPADWAMSVFPQPAAQLSVLKQFLFSLLWKVSQCYANGCSQWLCKTGLGIPDLTRSWQFWVDLWWEIQHGDKRSGPHSLIWSPTQGWSPTRAMRQYIVSQGV